MIFFLANSLACVLLAIFLNINDRRKVKVEIILFIFIATKPLSLAN